MSSTNSQTGMSTYSSNAPKVVRKVKETAYMGMTYKWFLIVAIWVFVSLFLLIPILMSSNIIVQSFIGAILVIWWLIYAKYFKSSEVFDRTILVAKFFFDGYSGLHTVAKYNMELKFLQDVFPLKEVLDHGLLEFKGGHYGVLIKIDPPRVTEDEIETHCIRMQEVIDSLAGNTMIKFIASSRTEMNKPLLNRISESMNKKNIPPYLYNYFLSLYNLVSNKNKPVINWSFHVFYGLGDFENKEDAELIRQAEIPGILAALKDANIWAVPITDRIEVAKEYRQLVYPVAI